MSLHRDTAGTGRELVLLHGWGMNLAVWESLRADLATHYRLTVIELPGHGASPACAVADPAIWAAACLSAAPPRAHWIGWSLGGQLALQAALQAPERVVGLSLIATTPRFVTAADWDCAMPRSTFTDFAAALSDDPKATVLRFLSLQVRGDEYARAVLKQLREELRLRPAAGEQGLQQGLDLLLNTDLRARLPDIACAQQWLFGERDTLVPRALASWLRAQLPAAHVDVIAGAGHAPLLSHPQQCLCSLREAIDDNG